MRVVNGRRGAPHIVILGAGFAGVEVARGLKTATANVTLVDKQNYHLFQPLLYQVATAALSPADIAEPIRRMLRRFSDIQILLGEVTNIDLSSRCLTLGDGRVLLFDYLVLATGAAHAYFGHEDWAVFAPSLKSIDDARQIRSRLLMSFELAEMTDDLEERKRLMTFVVVGGGPSGVELAGAVAELARFTLKKDFHHIDPGSSTVILLEAGPRILAGFPADLARYARRRLERLGVTVRESCAVENISATTLVAGGTTVAIGLAIWAAGVRASPLGAMLGVPTDRSGRVIVNRDLSIAGLPNVYVLGDAALVLDSKGNPLPGLAQVAKQEGHYLGRVLAKKLSGDEGTTNFEFHNRGNAAIIGRQSAIFDFGWWRLRGPLAWLLWALVHIYLLTGFQHRLLVAIQWLWRYLTYDRGARLIVEPASLPGSGRTNTHYSSPGDHRT